MESAFGYNGALGYPRHGHEDVLELPGNVFGDVTSVHFILAQISVRDKVTENDTYNPTVDIQLFFHEGAKARGSGGCYDGLGFLSVGKTKGKLPAPDERRTLEIDQGLYSRFTRFYRTGGDWHDQEFALMGPDSVETQRDR